MQAALAEGVSRVKCELDESMILKKVGSKRGELVDRI